MTRRAVGAGKGAGGRGRCTAQHNTSQHKTAYDGSLSFSPAVAHSRWRGDTQAQLKKILSNRPASTVVARWHTRTAALEVELGCRSREARQLGRQKCNQQVSGVSCATVLRRGEIFSFGRGRGRAAVSWRCRWHRRARAGRSGIQTGLLHQHCPEQRPKRRDRLEAEPYRPPKDAR